IAGQHSGAGISMQRGRWPRGWRGHQSMLDGVEMNVVGAAFEIAVIANIGSLSRISLFASCGLRAPTRRRRAGAQLRQDRCTNSDIENLELEHRHVSKSHRMLTRRCAAFDPPIDASGLDWGFLYRAGP